MADLKRIVHMKSLSHELLAALSNLMMWQPLFPFFFKWKKRAWKMKGGGVGFAGQSDLAHHHLPHFLCICPLFLF